MTDSQELVLTNSQLVDEVARLNSLVRKMRDENAALRHEATLASRRLKRALRQVSATAEKALKKAERDTK